MEHCINASVFSADEEEKDAALYSERAKELHATAEKYFQAMVSRGPQLPVEIIPPVADDKPGEKPSLHLPTTDFISERNAGIVRMDLKAIQHHLKRKPFKKANVLTAIHLATSSWETMYGALYPDDLWKLDSVLKALAHRLDGTANPDDYEEKDVTFAEKEARPFLKKLEAAYSDVHHQLKLVQDDRPKLETRRAQLEATQRELQKEAEKHDKLAAAARKREATTRSLEEAAAVALEAYDHAVARSAERVDALAQRREEVEAFLRRLERQQKPFDPDSPPEAAIVLAYPSS